MSRTPRTATRLFLVHAALSAVPVLTLGVVLDQTYRDQARDQGLAQGRAQAAVIEEMAVAPALSGRDLVLGLSGAERDQLAEATDLAVYQGSVLRLRLRDVDGDVVFSDDGREDGVLPADAPAFQAALQGSTSAELVSTPAGQAVRVLRPIVPGASGRSVGVLELSLPYEAIAEAVAEQVRGAWVRLLVGLVLLYAVLAALSWSTSRSLRRHAAQREHEALHDALTGLPNRSFFAERAARSVQAATPDDPVAVVLVDLDRFKHVNDTLGHHAGDALLCAVAARLQQGLRTDDVVARLGGDEFGLVLPHVTDAATALALVEQVHAELVQDLDVEGTTVTPGGSMGVALAPQHGSDVDALLKRADAAMYRGKRGSRSVLLASDEQAADDDRHALALHGELRRALERDELVLVYQPELDLTSGEVVGLEALVRWDHPERGVLGPVGFLPVVEDSDLVAPFTDWVVRRAVRDRRAWTAAGLPWSVSVNVSARNLETPGFADGLVELLAREAVPAGGVVVEITETALAADAAAVAASVERLAAAGVPISVDDFGTGWSSLAQLRALPVSEVKVDRSFVRDLATSSQDRALVQAVVALAHGLGCRVVAEGVETPDVADWLVTAGCDRAQGFLWSRPVPWPELVPAPPSLPAPRTPLATPLGVPS